ncbi:hypothetical protein RD792_000136 [Penstemon davidsonii]|uniref:Cystatin domain-containing protein n=1 Tax=Penstemon davidsonii TaxID=160366 RepID=A0ABR0DUA0_9LAMI|nr:hypothetical protein RD792_000136 [Penstemon davidsonii]
MAFKSHVSLLVLFVLVPILATAKVTSLIAWLPLQNPNDPHVVEIAKFAVAEHNKEAKASLVFITVVKGERQSGESQLIFGSPPRTVAPPHQRTMKRLFWRGDGEKNSFPFKRLKLNVERYIGKEHILEK